MSMYDDLKAHLQASALLGAYTFQRVFNEQTWQKNNRYCVIRFAGGRGDKHVRNATHQIHFIGAVNDSDVATLASDAETVLKYILNNPKYECIINLELILDVSGPYYTDSGRMQYYFEVGVKYVDTQ